MQVASFKNANKGLLLLQVAHDVAAGLAYLHPAVVHRDLKPQNILLEGGPAGRAKVPTCGTVPLHRSPVQRLSCGGAATSLRPPGPSTLHSWRNSNGSAYKVVACSKTCLPVHIERIGLCGQVADFGISRVKDPTKSYLSATNNNGTPMYMAPEQFNGTHLDEKVAFVAMLRMTQIT